MSLRLVTGPANSGRAGEVLGAYRARLAEEPVLVVPSYRDVEHSLRELAAGGAVLGARVVRFAGLFELIAERCGSGGATAERPAVASDLQRELLVEEAIRTADLRAIEAAAEHPGFVRACARLVGEIERSMVEPDVLRAALRAWSGGGERRRRALELADVYAGYRAGLERGGLVDADLLAWRAVDALRDRPQRFGRAPVLVYGFDDFTPVELDALATLSGPAGVDVTVSLPYERGRAAFRAVAPVFERLAGLADDRVELPAAAEHYASEARAALHHLERALYEAPGERPDPGEAIRLMAAGGVRGEVELVAAEVLRLLRADTAPGDVAIVFRDPTRCASVVEQVLAAYGIPYSLDRYVPLAHTALGRGLLALLRCSTREGSADDLLAYLRTPGLLELPRLADRLESEVRQAGARTVAQARALWEKRRWRLGAIDRVRRAAPGTALIEVLDDELDGLFAPAYKRSAPLFSDAELDDPRVFTAARRALAELRTLALADSGLELDARRVQDKLAALEVRLGEPARTDRVQVTDPESVRARRFEAVFVCGLQEGEFPRPRIHVPLLPDDDRRELAAASGLSLPLREDQLERERHLFYVACSRAERVLTLSHRFADDEGNPELPSFLLEDVRDLFAPALAERTLRRSLSDVAWEPDDAPTPAEWRRARALAGPRARPTAPDGVHDPRVREQLNGSRAYSASALELFADCPVRWLVERVLGPEELEPDPEPLVRGSYAHSVLEATYRRLREETGSARVTHDSLPRAERLLLEELDAQQSSFPISPKETRLRTAVRRLEFDLLRHLRREADAGGDMEPVELELEFGSGREGSRPPLRLEPEGVAIRGRVDRVDAHGGHAVVRDYKTGRRAYPVARWDQDNRLQVALYMLAVRELLGLEPVGGVYVPLADREGKPRGVLREDCADELGGGFAKADMLPAGEVEERLGEARARVRELAGRMRAGDVRPCPDSCAWNGGCSYPSICREERG